jgi:DNA polymerase III sliding clamp (beta) subunit (PCNA family)
MEFSVKKFDLLEELQLTQGVVERKTTIPILSNLLFEAKGNRLTITATDLEPSIRTSCEAKVKNESAGTIPAKNFLSSCACCPKKKFDSSFSRTTGSRSPAIAAITSSLGLDPSKIRSRKVPSLGCFEEGGTPSFR